MKKITNIVFPVVITTLSSFYSAASYAGDAKHYSGSQCVPNKASISQVSYGAIFNTSRTETLYISCPITKDEIRSHINNGHVDIIDEHYSQNVQCSLESQYNNNGGWWHWSDTKKSDGSSVKIKRLNYGSLGSNVNAYYYYFCRIPPMYNNRSSAVVSYYINER